MLGDRNLRDPIEKSFDRLYEESRMKIDAANHNKIHVSEAVGCTRFSYYERKHPLVPDRMAKMSMLIGSSVRRTINSSNNNNTGREYKIDDDLTLLTNADMIIAEEFVVRFEVVQQLPEIPHPRHILDLNACLFVFNKEDGFLIYITAEGKTVEFDITKSNRMFNETARRARVLSTLLKDDKVPIVEPSEMCIGCRYYERCYSREKAKESSGDFLGEIFGKK